MNLEGHPSPPTSVCRWWSDPVYRVTIVALAYFGAHHLAFLFPDTKKVLMAIWPAGGIGLAALLLHPLRLWPALLAAMFLAGLLSDFLTGRALVASLGFMTANGLESLACAWFISKRCGPNIAFNRVRDILALLVAATLVNALTACLGAATAAWVSSTPFGAAWWTWWVSDGLGILLLTPFLVIWFGRPDPDPIARRTQRGGWVEFAGFMVLWCGLAWLLFHEHRSGRWPGGVVRPYMLLPLLAWPALRFGQAGVTNAVVALAVVLVSGSFTPGRVSPWGTVSRQEDLLLGSLFLGFTAITGLLLAASHAEMQRHLASLTLTSAAARENEERQRMVLHLAMDGFWVVDLDGRILEVNQALCRMTGYSEAELLTLRIADLEVIESPTDTAARIRRIATQGEERFETRHRCKDGRVFDVEASTQFRAFQGGQCVAFLRDITERKQAEETLRETSAFLEEAQRVGQTGWYALDISAGHWRSSSILDEIFGITGSGYPHDVSGWLNLVHPEDRPAMAEYLQRHVLEQHHRFDREYRIVRCQDQSERWVHGRGELAFDAAGHPVQMFGVIVDITERKQVEKQVLTPPSHGGPPGPGFFGKFHQE